MSEAADQNRTLCFERFKAERDRQRAERLNGAERPGTLAPAVSLNDRQIAHRRSMLQHLGEAAADRLRVERVRQ